MKAGNAVSFTSFVLAFSYFVLFNIFDLSSTILALRLGLSEANFVLVFLSSSLGLALADIILLVKSLFFVGVGSLMILGVATKNLGLKKVVFVTIILFGSVFALVSLSNFISIYSVMTM
jgi:hypothetical protein